MEQKPFFGGVPVAPDVKLLIDAFGTPSIGTEMLHAELERVLGLKHTEARYRTVVTRWMETLWNDRNVRVIGIRGGFRVLSAAERLDQSERQRRKGANRLQQSVKEVISTPIDELDAIGKYRHEHLARTNTQALMAVKSAQRQFGLAMKNPPESLPKPIMPEGPA